MAGAIRPTHGIEEEADSSLRFGMTVDSSRMRAALSLRAV
jgi:hypothetical protein